MSKNRKQWEMSEAKVVLSQYPWKGRGFGWVWCVVYRVRNGSATVAATWQRWTGSLQTLDKQKKLHRKKDYHTSCSWPKTGGKVWGEQAQSRLMMPSGAGPGQLYSLKLTESTSVKRARRDSTCSRLWSQLSWSQNQRDGRKLNAVGWGLFRTPAQKSLAVH